MNLSTRHQEKSSSLCIILLERLIGIQRHFARFDERIPSHYSQVIGEKQPKLSTSASSSSLIFYQGLYLDEVESERTLRLVDKSSSLVVLLVVCYVVDASNHTPAHVIVLQKESPKTSAEYS